MRRKYTQSCKLPPMASNFYSWNAGVSGGVLTSSRPIAFVDIDQLDSYLAEFFDGPEVAC
jgi:hypothetical protein